MASQGDPKPGGDGIDLPTLVLSAIASAAAAYITSQIWGPGTLFSAAFAPVIVALVKEGLRRPTEVITNVVPTVPTPSRWTRAGDDDPGLVAQVDDTPATAVHPDPDAPPPASIVLPTERTPVRVYSTRGRRLRWRLALITGLLGFGIAVLVFTVPELIAGQSLGGAHKTTIFGGRHRHTSTTKTTTSTTSTSTQQSTSTATTPTETTTVTQTETVTTPAPATTPTTTTPTSTDAAPATTQPPAAQSAPETTTTP